MSSPEITTEDALWLFVGELPRCQHRRKFASDWFRESAAKVDVTCPNCKGDCVTGRREGYGSMMESRCWRCHGRGSLLVPNRALQLAEALVSTQDKAPSEWARFVPGYGEGRDFVFERSMSDLEHAADFAYPGRGPFDPLDAGPDNSIIDPKVFDAMEGESGGYYFVPGKHSHRGYETAADAVRDLCLGWCLSTYKGLGHDSQPSPE